ncbi:DNase I-like protein [Exidia glandulosa HHB12029]|uniref:DNase I-like protein n=1 Tax=Exidia glandulosa HHB12029 TaxID=1314781 RepID=A0A165LXF9_EXIGL|nr:DNase I-like protein [Exidia glandulosa HHB12029]
MARVHPLPGRRPNQPFLRLPVARTKTSLKTKAHLRIASQNMRGRSHAGQDLSKWREVEVHMRDQKVGILAVQETHLCDDLIRKVNLDRKELKLFCSPDPESPTNRGGVGVVLNKRLVQTQGARMWVLVPGKAIVVSFNWHREQKLSVLAVYAPNDPSENKEFWTTIRDALRQNADIPRPHVLKGDFNMVESMQDRFPASLNNADMSAEFQELLTYLELVDGWRETNPRKFSSTWQNPSAEIHARLDRIYVSEGVFAASRNWRAPGLRWCSGTDHLPVYVDLVNPEMPFVGKGHWSMGLHHLRIKKLLTEIVNAGKMMIREIDDLESRQRDPQNNTQLRKNPRSTRGCKANSVSAC